MKLTAAAWVSERPDEDWDVAAAAAAWVHERARDEGSTPVLVTAVFQSYGTTIDDLARRYPRTTQARDRHREAGPVLSYVPDEVQLHLAMRIAAQSSLVAVEGTLFPLEGWAAYLGAVNLRTGEQTPPLPEPLSDAVKHLRFYGNNVFSVPYDKQEAQSIVTPFSGDERTRELLLGAVLAAGVSDRGVKNLRRAVAATQRADALYAASGILEHSDSDAVPRQPRTPSTGGAADLNEGT